jgi:Zn-dependent protease
MDLGNLGYVFFGLYWVVFVYSIVLHEIAHGYSAFRLGDPTAWKAGRLSLNPLRHIDPMFSIVMPIIFYLGTGWPWGGAKPVPVNPLLFKDRRRGDLICTAAGPLTNVAIAVAFALLFLLFRAQAHGAATLTCRFLCACMLLNVFLAVFNLIPVPPLDGSHIVGAFLPPSMQEGWERLQAMGWIPMAVLVAANNLVWPFLSYALFFVGLTTLRLLGASGGEWVDTMWPKNLLGSGG